MFVLHFKNTNVRKYMRFHSLHHLATCKSTNTEVFFVFSSDRVNAAIIILWKYITNWTARNAYNECCNAPIILLLSSRLK